MLAINQTSHWFQTIVWYVLLTWSFTFYGISYRDKHKNNIFNSFHHRRQNMRTKGGLFLCLVTRAVKEITRFPYFNIAAANSRNVSMPLLDSSLKFIKILSRAELNSFIFLLIFHIVLYLQP